MFDASVLLLLQFKSIVIKRADVERDQEQKRRRKKKKKMVVIQA